MLVEVLPEQLGGELGRSGTRRRPPSIDTVEGKDWRGVLRVWGEGDGKSEGWMDSGFQMFMFICEGH